MKWHANRASGNLARTQLRSTMNRLADLAVLERLDLDEAPEANASISIKMEWESRANTFWSLITKSVSVRAWSLLTFTECLPYKFAITRHEKLADAEGGFAEIRQMWEDYKRLQDRADDPATNKRLRRQLQSLVRDLYWTREVLPCEMRLLSEACDWDAKHRDVQQLSWDLFSGACNTKRVLEDTFNVLHSASKEQGNGKVDRQVLKVSEPLAGSVFLNIAGPP
jgi:hypothetical protein